MFGRVNYLDFKDRNAFFKEVFVDKEDIFPVGFIVLWFECDLETWKFNFTFSVDVEEKLRKEIKEKREIWSFIFAFVETLREGLKEFVWFQEACSFTSSKKTVFFVYHIAVIDSFQKNFSENQWLTFFT